MSLCSTVTSFDDVLLTKFRGVICEVLDRLQEYGELEHVRSLYTQGSRAHMEDVFSRSDSPPNERDRYVYTFEHFVDHLDSADGTFHNLMELLVTTTARKAIAKAVEENDVTDDPVRPTPSSSTAIQRIESRLGRHSTRTSRECQREMMRSRALQGEIRSITRRNRRARRRGDDSDSSDSMRTHSPPPSRTVFSSLVDPNTFSPAVQRPTHDAATTRAALVGQSNREAERDAERWLQRDMSSLRRRMDRRREEVMRQARRNGSTSNVRADEPGFMVIAQSPTQGSQDPEPNSAFVRRFLSQPFPSDSRSTVQSSTTTASQGGLDATLAPLPSSPPSPVLFTNSATSLDPTDVRIEERSPPVPLEQQDDDGPVARLAAVRAALNRLNSSASPTPDNAALDGLRSSDFEAFSARRRNDRRARETEDRNEAELDAGEEATLDRAFASLSRADETVRQIMGEGAESTGTDGAHDLPSMTDPLARRLATSSAARSTIRLSPRSRFQSARRDDDTL